MKYQSYSEFAWVGYRGLYRLSTISHRDNHPLTEKIVCCYQTVIVNPTINPELERLTG